MKVKYQNNKINTPTKSQVSSPMKLSTAQVKNANTSASSSSNSKKLSVEQIQKMVNVCQKKVQQKGDNVGLSFYAFFANKNENPELLMDVATWWKHTHELDHFVKAHHIIKLLNDELGEAQ